MKNFFFVLCFLSTVIYSASGQDGRMIFKGVPIVNITMQNGKNEGDITKEAKLNATMTITNANGSAYISSQLFTGNITIKGRGNSTWNYPKRPYNIVTCDAEFKKKSVSLLGLPTESGWTLLAEYEDKTALRTLFTSAFSYTLGLPWCSRGTKVELYINGEYRGLYTLCEKVDRGINRINITNMKTTDISGDAVTGGYTIEKQFHFQIQPGEVEFEDQMGNYWSYKVPDSDVITPEQNEYIKNYMNGFLSKLSNMPFSDTINGYRSVINSLSFAQYYLLQDISKNGDAWNASWYVTKDRLKKMDGGPGWDWTLAWGALKAYNLAEPNDSGFLLTQKNTYYTRMIQDTFFANLVKTTFGKAVPKINQLISDCEVYSKNLVGTGALARDSAEWPYTLDSDIWNYIPNTQEDITFFINYIKQRMYYQQRYVYKLLPGKPVHTDLP